MKIQEYFHSSENTRFDIFMGEKPLDWNYFFLFSQYGLRGATLYAFLKETTIGVSYFYGNVNKKKLNKRESFYKFVNQNKS